ncbi:MAG: TraX family protein [Cellvibrionaceae bacterium]
MSSGTLEALKWFALIAMAFDHYNKFIYSNELPYIFEIGRTCLPIFAFVIGYKLTLANSLDNGAYIRVMIRLGIFGVLATPAYLGMNPYWWPLNIMFMFLGAVLSIYLLHLGGKLNITLAVFIFILFGFLVEWWWWGSGLTICAWAYSHYKKPIFGILFILVTASLVLINQNHFALLALPIIFGAQYIAISLPRYRWAFYVFYPLHLTIIWFLLVTPSL